MASEIAVEPTDGGFTSFHLRTLVLCGLLVFLDGFDLVGISYVGPEMMRVVGLTKPMFGSILSAALFGLTLGALIAGLAADKYGRRMTLIFCGAIFALGSIGTAMSASHESLLIWRFFTGLGLGGATPVAVALTSEFMPKRLRASLVIILYTNISLGGIVAGIVANYTLSYGWQPIFWLGGLLPFIFLPVLMAFLPESLEFLAAKGKVALLKGHATTASPSIAPLPGQFIGAAAIAGAPLAVKPRLSLQEIFAERLALTTSILWFIFFVSLVALYFYQAWLPTLLRSDGMTVRDVVIIGAIGQVGTLAGSLMFARLVASIPPFVMVGSSYIGGAIVFFTFSQIGATFWMWCVVSFFAGVFIAGTQNSCNAVTALVYPPRIRATGVGWAIGIGRIGAILGPALAGILLGLSWTNAQLFVLAAVGPSLAALGCFWVARRTRDQLYRSRAAAAVRPATMAELEVKG